ncbi:30S ribosomal protein S2 [Candidatus Woesearchaeota archaeon]|nr:30S ribosomal protein S2 [Candidatus Woesearchaeota archaeon]
MTETEQYMVPVDEYLKVGLHIGTKFRTRVMEPFIYKVRPDGLSVLNVQKVDERIKFVANMISKYNPQDILVISRRENGWKPVQVFGNVTGVHAFAGRYPPGILTNTDLDNFMEVKLIFVTDPFPDKNVILDAAKIGVPVIALCDTNNELDNVDLVIPCNNKGKKSLGLIFMILAKEYLKSRGIIKENSEFKLTLDDFSSE